MRRECLRMRRGCVSMRRACVSLGRGNRAPTLPVVGAGSPRPRARKPRPYVAGGQIRFLKIDSAIVAQTARLGKMLLLQDMFLIVVRRGDRLDDEYDDLQNDFEQLLHTSASSCSRPGVTQDTQRGAEMFP